MPLASNSNNSTDCVLQDDAVPDAEFNSSKDPPSGSQDKLFLSQASLKIECKLFISCPLILLSHISSLPLCCSLFLSLYSITSPPFSSQLALFSWFSYIFHSSSLLISLNPAFASPFFNVAISLKVALLLLMLCKP